MPSVKKHREALVEAMRQVNTYRPEFDTAIDQLAVMLHEHDRTKKEFRDGGSKVMLWRQGKYDEYQVKNPLIGMMEKQRRDILDALGALGLTPAGLKKINDEMKKRPKPVGGISGRVMGK